ncbi:transglycosylase SLT domain-containing protein [Aminobacter sp. HY435]|uniref:transglycosylase SLT domain-containing protein n=1 Tax=Aminobacter sp. HY435 TaxID=2970917 RepID=UPI003FA424F7
MPAHKTHLLITAAIGVALLSGCQTNTAALSTDLSTGADVALSAGASQASAPGDASQAAVATQSNSEMAVAEAELALPETVAVLPTSFAPADNSQAGVALAAAMPTAGSNAATAALPATPATDGAPAAKMVAAADAATAATAAAAPAVAKAADSKPEDAPMAGGEIVLVAGAPKLVGEFPSAPTIADYALPAKAPVPASYQVASLGNVAPESFATSSYAAPDSPARASRGKIDELISKYAALYEVPEKLVRRVVNRESTFNPMAYNRGHWGLMQIKHATARGMGYDGPANGLFDAETNLKFAVKYLRGAWLVSEGDEDQADKLYQSGYYYHAKRKGLLDETGLGRDRVRHRG